MFHSRPEINHPRPPGRVVVPEAGGSSPLAHPSHPLSVRSPPASHAPQAQLGAYHGEIRRGRSGFERALHGETFSRALKTSYAHRVVGVRDSPHATMQHNELTSPANTSAHFGLFAYLWALSALFDLIPKSAWLDSPAHALLACCAVFVVLRPSSLAGFALLSVARLAAFVQDSPNTPNHQVLFALASAAILCATLPLLWRERQAPPGSPPLLDHGAWFSAFAPLLRLLLVGLYFFAVLHKLNWAYFDPSVSCGVTMFRNLAPSLLEALLPGGDVGRYALIYGGLAAELTIPVLLCFPRTRLLGFAVGVLFHSFLGLGYFHFSTGVFAFYTLFIPASVATDTFARVKTWRQRSVWRERLTTPMAIALMGLALVAAMVVMGELDRLIYRQLRYLWMAGMLTGLAVLVLAPARWPLWRETVSGRLRDARLGFVFPIALLFCGMSPYLGLRTVPAFSMFSNLRTEGGISNHLFMPATALHIAGYQDDLVRIEATNRPALKRWAGRGRLRTFFEFRSQVQKMLREEDAARRDAGKPDLPGPPLLLQFERGGKRYTLRNAGENPEIMAEIGWLERKWMHFRAVPGERQACSW